MPNIDYSANEAAQALVSTIGQSRWEAVAFAHGYLALCEGKTDEQCARILFERGAYTLKRSRELIVLAKAAGFLSLIPNRMRTGSAQNPITKLFPAAITEQRFLELLDELHSARPTLSYTDTRESGHTLSDFILVEEDLELPINIKNAGTRFERAQQLVRLAPDDCIPIPAYKAHAAVESLPTLLYIVSVDYDLITNLNALLPGLLTREELIVWDILNKKTGGLTKAGEDAFVFKTVRKYWDRLRGVAKSAPFRVISARKAIRILQTKPHRTPGIGLRAWGTGASAEVNVHVSIKDDMTPWESVRDRLLNNGIADIVSAVNRKKVEETYDPEI